MTQDFDFFGRLKYHSGPGFVRELMETVRKTHVVHVVGPETPPDDPRPLYEPICRRLGELVPIGEELVSGVKTGILWQDIRYDPVHANTYLRHSTVAHPLHTDSAYESEVPDLSFLCCVNNDVEGGATIFIDGRELIRQLEKHDPQLLEDLKTTPLRFAKGHDQKIRPVIIFDDIGPILTWNHARAEAMNERGRFVIDRFCEFLEHRAARSENVVSVALKPGDGACFRDERVLHGRRAFVANERNARFLWKLGIRETQRMEGVA